MHIFDLMVGALAMAFACAGLFFLRFWRETHDRLFGLFALSFFILAVNRIGLALVADRHTSHLYWVRIAAFALILLAIVDKNRTPARPESR